MGTSHWECIAFSLQELCVTLSTFLSGLLIPANNTMFIKLISEKLAANEPYLTLEFLEECIQGFRQSSIELKHLCLEYMTPWLANLPRYLACNGQKLNKP